MSETAGNTASGKPSSSWPAAAATALGPLPGTDIEEALRTVVGELPELPFLPELPGRGVGADLAGRAIGLLIDIWAEVVPSGWRISRRPTREVRRAKDFLAWDGDAVEGHAAGAPLLKVQCCGPLSLGALLELPSGNRAVTDPGAVADLTASLAEGLAGHLATLASRLPGTALVVQIDEPLLAAVLDGTLSSPSGLSTVPAVDRTVVAERLGTLLAALAAHRIAVAPPAGTALLPMLQALDLDAVVVDMTRLGRTSADLDPLGVWLESGRSVLAAATQTVPRAKTNGAAGLAAHATPITEALSALGFSPASRSAQVIPMPAPGLEHAAVDQVASALRLARDVARLLGESDARTEA